MTLLHRLSLAACTLALAFACSLPASPSAVFAAPAPSLAPAAHADTLSGEESAPPRGPRG